MAAFFAFWTVSPAPRTLSTDFGGLSGFGPDGYYRTDGAIASMRILCTNMKAKGITIIAIAYDIDDPLGKDDLKFCASDGQYYGEKYYIEATAATLAGMMTATATELIKGHGKRKGQVKLVR